jgi:hypothetical protein
MKKHKFKIGDIVTHDFSSNFTCEIHDVRNNREGYDYFIRWIDPDDENQGAIPIAKDWYQESALLLVDQSDKKEEQIS